MSDQFDDNEWEVCDLWHDVVNGKGIHSIRLSIHKKSDHRQTYCVRCGHSVKFYRKADAQNVEGVK